MPAHGVGQLLWSGTMANQAAQRLKRDLPEDLPESCFLSFHASFRCICLHSATKGREASFRLITWGFCAFLWGFEVVPEAGIEPATKGL